MIVSDATWLPFHFPDPQDAWEVHFWRRQAEGSPKLRVRLFGWKRFVVAFSKLRQAVQVQYSGGLDFKSKHRESQGFTLPPQGLSRKPADRPGKSCLANEVRREGVWGRGRGAFWGR